MAEKRKKGPLDDFFKPVSVKKTRTSEPHASVSEIDEEPVPGPSVILYARNGYSAEVNRTNEVDSNSFEDEDDAESDGDEQGEISKKDEMKKRVTIYKINNKFLSSNIKDNDSLRRDLTKTFKEKYGLTPKEKKDYQQDLLKPYNCIWFTCEYGKDDNKNTMSEFYNENLTGKPESIPKGNRRTGNLLILYRMMDVIDGGRIPEVFVLCDSYPPQKLLCISDSTFRTNIANALMDGKRIVKLETMNIAGPEIRTRRTFSSQPHVNCPAMNEVVTAATSIMRTDNSVLSSLGGNKEKPIKMSILLNCFRFEMKMNLEQCAGVLDSLQRETNKGDGVTFYNFEYVYRDVDKERCNQYEKTLKATFIETMCSEKDVCSHDLSLNHRYSEEWSDTLLVRLSKKIMVKRRNQYDEIYSWGYSPPFGDLKSRLQTYYKTLLRPYTSHESPNIWRNRLQNDLENDLIYLSFERGSDVPTWQSLHKYVHGSISSREPSCKVYKLAQKWYVLTTAFSRTIDRNFVEFAKGAVLSKEKGLSTARLPIPWYSSSKKKQQQRGFTPEEMAGSLSMKVANTEEILNILLSPVKFMTHDLKSNLTKKSCSFLDSFRIYKDMQNIGTNTEGKKDEKKKSSTVNTTEKKKGGKKSDGKDGLMGKIQSALYKDKIKCLDEIEEVRDILQTERKIIRWDEKLNSYQVQCANLTKDQFCRIKTQFPEDIDDLHMGILRFLRSRSVLTEGEYNETYLLLPEEDDKIYIPGDRVLFNNVELFDILMHDSSNNVTYLYHVKEGLGQPTRDACSQIRVSSQLFWMDRLGGKSTNAEGFYQKATDCSSSQSPYRYELQERINKIGKTKFVQMFQTKLIFVYAFLSKTVREKLHPADLSDFKPLEPSLFGTNGTAIVSSLKAQNIVTDLGYLDDTFLDETKENFPTLVKNDAYLSTLPKTEQKIIYDILVKHGRCDVSTIAKLELLELDREFSRYQIAGEKVFELKVLQI